MRTFKGFKGWECEKCEGEYRGSLVSDGESMILANCDRIPKGKCDKCHSRTSGMTLVKLMVGQLRDKGEQEKTDDKTADEETKSDSMNILSELREFKEFAYKTLSNQADILGAASTQIRKAQAEIEQLKEINEKLTSRICAMEADQRNNAVQGIKSKKKDNAVEKAKETLPMPWLTIPKKGGEPPSQMSGPQTNRA